MTSPLPGLNHDASIAEKTDWAELEAFFSSNSLCRLDELTSQEELGQESESEDIGSADAAAEDMIGEIAVQIQYRRASLEQAYPYSLSDDGEVLSIEKSLNVGSAAYVFCLVMSHAYNSDILPKDIAPRGKTIRDAREVFQICATLAGAGTVKGPSFSFGHPRPDRSPILTKIQQIWRHIPDGKPVTVVPVGVSANTKDEGIDVIACWPTKDKLPGQGILIGQVASGGDWKTKSVIPDMNRFFKTWFFEQPVQPFHPYLFIPFLLSDIEMKREIPRFGVILHRLRVPTDALAAVDLHRLGVGPIERIADGQRVIDWVQAYKDFVVGRMS